MSSGISSIDGATTKTLPRSSTGCLNAQLRNAQDLGEDEIIITPTGFNNQSENSEFFKVNNVNNDLKRHESDEMGSIIKRPESPHDMPMEMGFAQQVASKQGVERPTKSFELNGNNQRAESFNLNNFSENDYCTPKNFGNLQTPIPGQQSCDSFTLVVDGGSNSAFFC